MYALLLAGLFVAGVFAWTFMEYSLHRFAFHEMKGRGVGSRAHLDHHVRANWIFDPLILWAWFGVVLVGAAAALLTRVATGRWGPGVALGGGWVFAYFFYEWHHAQAHLRAPRNRWERFVRKHHFHHHFGHPRMNQGVTSSLWDKVFRTETTPEQVRVPRRLAMEWLVDDGGEIRPEFADDYVLAGPKRSERHLDDDQPRAYSNEAPLP